jgi:hypothetical protein
LCNEAYNDVNGTAVTATLSPTAGNGVEVIASFCATGGCGGTVPTQTATISDNVNSPEPCFTQAPHSPYTFLNSSVPDSEKLYAWYCPSIPSGVTSITVTTSASSASLQIDVAEWKAGTIASSNYFENVDQVVNSGSTANLIASVPTNSPTVNANDLITAVVANCGANVPATVGAGYTGIIVNPPGTLGHIFEAEGVTATGIQTATTTWSSGTPFSNCGLGAGGSSDTWFGIIVPLSSSGVGTPQMSVVPTSVNFGTLQIGLTNTQTVAVSNPGTGNLNIMQTAGPGTGFDLSGLALPMTVAPGKSTTFMVSFTPTSGVSSTSSLTLVSNAPNSPTMVALSGSGSTPLLQLTPSTTSLSFGSETLGASSTQSVTLTNTGNSAVTISQVNVTGARFSLNGAAPLLTLAAGQTASFGVAFSPTVAGSATGNASVLSTATNSPISISPSGSGAQSHLVNLSWSESSSGVVGYNVYSSTQPSGPLTKRNTMLVGTTAYTDNSVQSGQTYYYCVTAVDSNGNESACSNDVSATIP